ncbi:MAG: WHG domain-containing protein [Ruminococcaceae bacterium]|nr:WHG domain-containing protein [Oscillospiraceae bacterium]
MPPKVKITKQDIVNAALSLVRGRGRGALNARAVAAALGCSTQPVFSNFATMEALEGATIAAAHARYLGFLKREVESEKYPPYKAFGMAYIRFAKEEGELFRLLFMRDRSTEDTSPTIDFEEAVEMIAQANGVSLETARLMHLEMWAWVHGIGTMLVTSFLSLDQSLISDMLTDAYQGLRARHVMKEGQA